MGHAGQVAADANVDRLAVEQRRGDGVVDLLVRTVQVRNDYLKKYKLRLHNSPN